MTRVDERVADGTRIAEWVSDEPVRGMAFSLGRFDVTTVDEPGRLPITVYENRYETGFAPGNLEKTIEDLEGSIRFYTDYFGPYPYRALNATEIVTYTGQAFPGLVLLSFQAFGRLNTGSPSISGPTRSRTSGGARRSTGRTTATSGSPRGSPTTPPRCTCSPPWTTRTSSRTSSTPGGSTCSAR